MEPYEETCNNPIFQEEENVKPKKTWKEILKERNKLTVRQVSE